MKRFLSIFCLIFVMSNLVYGADGEDNQSSPSPTSSQNSQSSQSETGGANSTNQNRSPTTSSITQEKDSNSWLPLTLAGVALLFALIAMVIAYLFRGKSDMEIEGIAQDVINNQKKGTDKDGLRNLKEILDKTTNQQNEKFEKLHTVFNNKISEMSEKITSLEKELTLLKSAKKGLSDERDDLKIADNSRSLKKISSDGIPMLRSKEMDDQSIIDEISDSIKSLLQEPQEENIQKFDAINQKPPLSTLIVSSLALKSNLNSETKSTRYFDALVLFLKNPLANGANTLVYLRSDISQHSSISAIFENVSDGAKIRETVEPALLIQHNLQTLDINEQFIVKKGTVNLVG